MSGRFDYDRRGILDRDHIRFFTRKSFERLARSAGLSVRRHEAIGLPIEVVDRGGERASANSGLGRNAKRLDRAGVTLCPTLFAYQYLFELEPVPG